MYLVLSCLSVLLILTESTALNASAQITSRLNPSNSFLTTVNYDISSCACSGTDNLRYNGIWVSWNNQKGSRPDNAVYAGDDASGSGYMYVMRVPFYDVGLVVGKFSPNVKGTWIPYGGYEYGGFSNFEVICVFHLMFYIALSMFYGYRKI